MAQFMVVIMVIWIGSAIPMLAEEDDTVGQANVVREVFVGDQGRRHQYERNLLTGKAVRIFPNLNVLDFSDGEEIGESNAEQIARKVLKAVEVFS